MLQYLGNVWSTVPLVQDLDVEILGPGDPDFKISHEYRPDAEEIFAGYKRRSAPIIHQEENFMAISKPAGVSTEQALQTLSKQLLKTVFSISRLDLPTSGILPLVVGEESSLATRWFFAQFAGSLALKEYLCLCIGEINPPFGKIDLPLLIEACADIGQT